MSPLDRQGKSTLLLLRLLQCPTDAEAWDQLARRYGGTIYNWCRRYGLQDADAQDVTQNVFASLLHRLSQFDRSRARFRTWLYTIVHNCVRDWREAAAQRQESGTKTVWQLLASQEAERDLEARLCENFDLELLELAETAVRLQVEPNTWAAYQCFCKEQLSLKKAAERIGIPAGHVSKYARRVRDMVSRQITLLEERGEAAGGQPGNGATT
jgi:RNA polymerase sigma factor (sigma-70 family)